MPNPHPVTAGNAAWRAAMAMARFKPGWTGRTRCKALKRDGTHCGRLAMVRHGLTVCACHGGAGVVARRNLRRATKKSSGYALRRAEERGMKRP